MAKKAAFTGTQKKANKQVAKAVKAQAEQYQKQIKPEAKERQSAQHAVKQIAKGRHIPEYEGKTKYEPTKVKPKTEYEPTKFKPQTEYEHKTLGQLTKDFERAGRGLEPMFEARKQAVLADFSQNVAPQISNAAGASDSGKSSAVRQAIAGAQSNLHRNLSADFEGMRNQIAGGLLNSREQQRQFGAQFGSGQEQFYNQLRNQQQQFGAQFGGAQEQYYNQLRNQQQQFGAQFGAGQEQNAYNAGLQGLNARLQANQLLLGNPVTSQFSNLQNPYLQKQQAGSSGIGGALIGGGLGALGSFAGTEAGSLALAGLFASSRDIKDNIRDYEKGLETLRDLEVKQYDYNIPIEGRSNNRVGLIAENVPEEIQAMIGNIKAVDIYALVGLLVNSIKQLDMKVKALERQHV